MFSCSHKFPKASQSKPFKWKHSYNNDDMSEWKLCTEGHHESILTKTLKVIWSGSIPALRSKLVFRAEPPTNFHGYLKHSWEETPSLADRKEKRKTKKHSCVWLHYINYTTNLEDATTGRLPPKWRLRNERRNSILIWWGSKWWCRENFGCFLRLQILNGRDITLIFLFENFI